MEKKMLIAMSSPKARPLGGRPWRWVKTLFFLASMLVSLLLDCAPPPLLVVVLDLLFPAALISAAAADSSLSAAAMSHQLRSFRFRSSLVDLPLVSALRSVLILCAFLACGGSRGAYLGVASVCGSASVVYVLLKVSGMAAAEAADSSLRGGEPRRVLSVAAGDNVTAAVEALFLASVAMAVAHIVVAYRTSCRERRKMLVYRIDVEAVTLTIACSRIN
ncbi:hypothetical protein ZIOFF_076011 [Zingiber officinale]|uniref:Uncharacterized protein n=1 Tax=Zingiber officinale TaxID=94328 RepID=A0A8J5CPN1_ZINOF|nr:hypothetical protein ZIOFF_076011 [Zingiber officinale]